MMGVGAASPAVVGFLSEATTYAVSFSLLAVVFGLGAVVVAALALADSGDDPAARPPR